MTQPAETGRGRKDQPPAFVTQILEERESAERIFEGKTALVIGATRDIGAGIALGFAIHGASVIGVHRDAGKDARAQPVIDAINSCGGLTDFPLCDINNAEDRTRLQQTIEEKFGGQLDFFVLNASVGPTLKKEAVVALALELLPVMKQEGKVFLLQSTPAHFSRQIEALGQMPKLYEDVAEEKYQLWQDLLSQKSMFDKYQVTFINMCAPFVPETWNGKRFIDRDPTFEEKNNMLSDALGLPHTVSIKTISQKATELATRDDLPFGYVELFDDNVYDAQSLLKPWYPDDDILIETVIKKTGRTYDNYEEHKAWEGRLVLTPQNLENGSLAKDFIRKATVQTLVAAAVLQGIDAKSVSLDFIDHSSLRGQFKTGDVISISVIITEETNGHVVGETAAFRI